jgi:hypothetical protein
VATYDDFILLLPQFEDVNEATITAYLAEAAKTVDSSWGAEQDHAQILLAAHLMSMLGIGPEKGAAALAGVKTIRSGSLTVEKDDKLGDYGLTSFGKQYYPLLIGTRSGPRVTGTGNYPYPYGGDPVEYPGDAF